MYVFTEDEILQKRMRDSIRSGTAAMNDTIVQFASNSPNVTSFLINVLGSVVL